MRLAKREGRRMPEATSMNNELLYYILTYDRDFGHPPTVQQIIELVGKEQTEKVQEDLYLLDYVDWIRLHPGEEQDIEVPYPMAPKEKGTGLDQ